MKINDKNKLTTYITLNFEPADLLKTNSFATILKTKQKDQINLDFKSFSKENFKNDLTEKQLNDKEQKTEEKKSQSEDLDQKSKSAGKKTEKEKKLENPLLALPQNLICNLQQAQQLLILLRQKIAEIIETTNSDFEEKIYNFRLDSDNILPLELAIKKIDGKYAIKLFSNGILKEEILNNLDQLLAYLRQRGFEILNIQVAEFSKQEKREKDEQQKKRQMPQSQQDDNIIIGEDDDIFKTGND
jgi:hypothetical protein